MPSLLADRLVLGRPGHVYLVLDLWTVEEVDPAVCMQGACAYMRACQTMIKPRRGWGVMHFSLC